MNRKRYYIAYGSNLNLEQMKRRCPTAEVVGTSELKGYKLAFKGALVNAYATIEECADSTVPVLIWSLQEKDEKSLDRYEGYPTFYFKEMHTILVNGEYVDAMVYIMNKKREVGIPSGEYYNIVRQGYDDNNLSINYLETAMRESINYINKRY